MPFFFNTSNNSSLYNKILSCENNGTATQMEKLKLMKMLNVGLQENCGSLREGKVTLSVSTHTCCRFTQ